MAGEEEKTMAGVKALLSWAALIGISDSHSRNSPLSSCLGHSLFVSDFPGAGGRGLGAARELRRGELVLRVPKVALLTTESVLLDPKISSLMERHKHLSPVQRLIVCLLVEVDKGRSSKWYTYLSQLPQDYTTLSNFTVTEIKSLQVDDAIWVAEKAAEKSKSDWNGSLSLLKELDIKPQLLKFKSWLWASQTVSSRTLHVPWDEAGCLCPVGDLFNYDAPDDSVLYENDEIEVALKSCSSKSTVEAVNTSTESLTDGGYEESSSSYCLYARRRYKQGEQVLLSYGTYTNLELLEHYGFLLPQNPNDKAFIKLDPDLYKITSWTNESLYIQPDGTPSFVLLCALRLWVTPISCRKSCMQLVISGSQISVQNEVQVLNWLAKRCYETLWNLPTTIKEDKILVTGIDKFQKGTAWMDFSDFGPVLQELKNFFEGHNLKFEESKNLVLDEMPIRVRKSLERWRLAVEWRLGYKDMIFKCFCYCKEKIDELSPCSKS
ncbi:protein SET DOMAIN GROUP 40 isoform X2 [Carex littledalei]|uniref:Protein SET DOMAIN GROUP 40 isoform X2 n=1 Tax=Carex littledalei TaxID=544730 RepID=A0A833RIA3_9POAL|nr:protein SET DOMAIN GROUP 40 isoform X2 [Carex littledalei]